MIDAAPIPTSSALLPPLPCVQGTPRPFTDGLIVFVKRGCPTCQQVAPLLAGLVRDGVGLIACSQDDPAFPARVEVHDDRALELSFRWDIEATPTLVRVAGGVETGRAIGWDRAAWIDLAGERVAAIADALGLPPMQPG